MSAAETVAAFRPERQRRGYLWDAFRRLRRNRVAMVSLGLITLLVLVAIFADVIAPHDPSDQFLEAASGIDATNPPAQRDTGKFEAPSSEHLLGTDQLARDILSRTVFGLRISLGAAFFAIVVVILAGLLMGRAAATSPQFVDDFLMRFTDVAYAFPDLLLIILLRAAFGNELFGVSSILGIDTSVLLFFAISASAWATTARLARGQLLRIRELEYTVAARSSGASPLRVAVRHMLPNAMSPVIVEATFLVPRAILAEATLSFIGFGVPPPAPSLGRLINDHFDFVLLQWTGLAIPCLILAVLFLALQFFGDGLRDALDPRSARAV